MDLLIDAVYQQESEPSHTSSIPFHPYNNAPAASASATQTQDSPSQALPQPQGGPPHRCHLCARTYERADHLNRHLKSHENARLHKCSRCTKSFNRADLLNRHQASHDRHAKGDSRPRIERGERVATACRACVTSKSKCQEQKPCARCLKRGLVCEDSGGSRDNRLPDLSSPLVRREALVGDGSEHAQSLAGSMAGSQSGYDSPYSDSYPPNVTGLQHPTSQPAGVVQGDIHASGSGYYDPSTSTASSYLNGPFQTLGYLPDNPHFSSPGLGFMPQDSFFGQDYEFAPLDMDLESVELVFQFKGTQLEGSGSDYSASNRQKDISKRFAAFERSQWLWTPTKKDHAMNDKEDLSLDEERIRLLAPASPAARMNDFSFCCINSKIRDQVLGLLLSVRRGSIQVPSFPSLALLNNIIQIYFVQNSFRIDHLVHAATFDPQKALPHLLIAILAEGSTFISTPAIWKFGFALQEIVRHIVGDSWDDDNSNTRNVQSVQAFVIWLSIGLWSGVKRKMQLAEGFANIIVSLLRRAGAYAAPQKKSIVTPERNDSDVVLESKWRKWAEMESWKRMALHLFMHDIHASIGLQAPPQISFSELKFALPASRELWLAKSAAQWRDQYLSASFTSELSSTSLPDAMQTPDTLVYYSTHVDVHLSAVAIVHGFWGQIWYLLESKKFYPSSKATHRLCLFTSHTELYRDLVTFSNMLPSLTRNSAEAKLVAETLMMVLHASPGDVQRFAGKHGEDEARSASGEFGEWTRTMDSRIAIWHAGQLLRAANGLGQAQCRGFNAIAVYYASLTMWIYGLMATPPPISPNSRLSTEKIVLNEPENSSTRSWRSTNEGTPGLVEVDSDGNHVFVPVEDTNRILQMARTIYKNNFPAENAESAANLPPLVENMRNLLRDLGDEPGSRLSTASSEGTG